MPDLPPVAAAPPLPAPEPRPSPTAVEPVQAPVRPQADSRPDAPPERHAPVKPPPIAVDVARDAAGVFVYTLRDPATDTVLAVIPREAVQPDRDGRNLDQRA